jgi:uncharacterized protein YraI
MRRQFVQCCYAGLTSLLLVPAAVFAQTQAVTNSPVNLRAGPARDYPVVSQLPGGAPVTVMGCVAGYTWCDVALPNLRGWVYAGRISYPYQGNPVPVLNYGTVIGLPLVTFSIGTYWGNYYRGRPWYHDQSRWAHHPPPPPPRPGAGRPPGRPPGPPPGGPGGRPPGGRPPGGHPPGNGGGRPPGGQPPGNGGGRPPGGQPPGNGGGRPPGGQPPGNGGGRPPGGQPPGNGGGRPPGSGGGRPPGGQPPGGQHPGAGGQRPGGSGGSGGRPPGGGGGGGGNQGQPPPRNN